MSKWNKFLLLNQIIIANFVAIVSSTHILKLRTITDCFVNVGAVVIINDLDNLMGKLFKLHLKTYHEEMAEHENLLRFEITRRDKEIAYIWTMSFLILFSVSNAITYLKDTYTICIDFDAYYE